MDNFVIGTAQQLNQFLTATEVSSISGSFIAVKALPGDPSKFLVVITGRSDEEVSQACLAFAHINFPLPDSQYALIRGLNLPAVNSWIRNAPLDRPGAYTLRTLGARTGTVIGYNTGGFQIPLYLPGDFKRDLRDNAELRLNFVYGAGLRADSVVNISVNGQFQHAIHLNDVHGANHYNHRVFLPVRSFQPGRNTVDLTPVMVPLETDQCKLFNTFNLQFTLYNDSALLIPSLTRNASLPNLKLLSQSAFPYAISPNGSELAVHVATRDPAVINGTWMVMAKMAQVSGALLANAEMSFRQPRSNKNLLVIGTADQLSDELLALSPVSPMQVGRMRYLVSTSPKPETVTMGPVENLVAKITGRTEETQTPDDPTSVEQLQTSELENDTVALQFESNYARGKAVTVLTSGRAEKLLEGLRIMQDRRIWDNLDGDLAVWNADPNTFASCYLGPSFTYGAGSIAARITTGFGRNPWLYVVLLAVSLGALAFITRYVLHRRAPRDIESFESDSKSAESDEEDRKS